MEASSLSSLPLNGGPRRLAFLDVLRGAAIFMVVAIHAMGSALRMDHFEWNGWWWDFAHAPRSLLLLTPVTLSWISVPIFIAVSGFCIHLSYERSQNKEWKPFFQRRFFRLYPPYLLALCFFTFVLPFTRYADFTWKHLVHFGSHLFLIHNMNEHTAGSINGSFWYLAVEAQLCLTYPLLLWVARRLGWGRALLMAGGIEGTLRLGESCFGLPCCVNTSPFFFWLSWGAGAKLADDYLHGRPLFLARWPLWIFVAAAFGTSLFRPTDTFAFLFAALMTVRIIAAGLTRPDNPVWSSLLARWLGGLGVFSYSLYLINQPFLNTFVQLMGQAFPGYAVHRLLLYFGELAACSLLFTISWLLYRWVELPSAEWGKRFVQRRSRAKSAIPAAYASQAER